MRRGKCLSDETNINARCVCRFEQVFANDGVFARIALIEVHGFRHTIQTAMEVFTIAFFRPNTLFMPLLPDTEDHKLPFILDRAAENGMRRFSI